MSWGDAIASALGVVLVVMVIGMGIPFIMFISVVVYTVIVQSLFGKIVAAILASVFVVALLYYKYMKD